jgi:stage V sporulation protein B
MMIPSGLRRYGVDPSRALGLYGIISGMVFPVLFFPSAFLYAASDLVMPEFAACHASQNKKRTLIGAFLFVLLLLKIEVRQLIIFGIISILVGKICVCHIFVTKTIVGHIT